MAKLTPKQKRFGDEYLIDLNATQAAIRAGYSPRTANEQGAQLLAKLSIQEYVRVRMAKREQRTEITADRVLQELAKIGFSNIKDYLAYRTERAVVGMEDGKAIYGYQDVIELKPSDQVDGALIAEVKHTKDGIAFKLHDKVAALDKIGRHLGMFTDKLEVSGELTIEQMLTGLDDGE